MTLTLTILIYLALAIAVFRIAIEYHHRYALWGICVGCALVFYGVNYIDWNEPNLFYQMTLKRPGRSVAVGLILITSFLASYVYGLKRNSFKDKKVSKRKGQ